MTKETKAILNMLDHEEDLKFDVRDRFLYRNVLDEEVFSATVEDLAFVLEDELRASLRHSSIDASMWSDIILPVIEKADYKEISALWLNKTREARLRIEEKADA